MAWLGRRREAFHFVSLISSSTQICILGRLIKDLLCSGDSYTATSFDVSGRQPSAKHPLGNLDLADVESKYGSSWPFYITMSYNQSKIQTYNMAQAGAVVLKTIVEGEHDFHDQIKAKFSPAYVENNAAIWNSDDSLFAIWFGINDVHRLLEKNIIRSGFENMARKVMNSYYKGIEKVSEVTHMGDSSFLLCAY